MTMTPIELLTREIRAQRNRLMNAIVCRRDHPSYGYTKKGILEDLAVLEGMLYAFGVVALGETSGSRLLQARGAYTHIFEENLDSIRQMAEKA